MPDLTTSVGERVRSAIEAEAAHTAGLLARELALITAQFDASAQQSQLHVMQRIDLVSAQARVGLGDARGNQWPPHNYSAIFLIFMYFPLYPRQCLRVEY